MHSKGAFDSGDGRVALTLRTSSIVKSYDKQKKPDQRSGEKPNPFDMFDSSNPFKEYSDNEGVEDERPPSLSSRGSYRSNSSAEDAIRRSEIALARLIENVQLSGIEIPFSAIKPGRRVGAGAFAVVYEGKYRGQSVAVKHLQLANINEKVILDFHTGSRNDKSYGIQTLYTLWVLALIQYVWLRNFVLAEACLGYYIRKHLSYLGS